MKLFIFVLAMIYRIIANSNLTPPVKQTMRKINLLILEDMEFDAAIMQKVLQRSGMEYEAVIASNKFEFISAIENNTFDVILSDNSLPEFDATQAIQLLTEKNIDTPVILVTGTVSEEFAVKMMRSGACDYILKDRLQRLPNAIVNAIDRHTLEREKQNSLNEIIIHEALMKESERLAHFGSWQTDLVNFTAIWSDENYRVLGYTPGEVTPGITTFLNTIHPDDFAYVKKTLEDSVHDLKNTKFECRIVNKDGSVRHLENQLFITLGEDGNPLRLNGFSIDVSERKQAEELLSISEANLRTIFDNTETAYGLLDADLNIISFNQTMYNFSVEQLAKPLEIGKYAISFLKPERQVFVRRAFNDAVSGIASNYEIPYLQPDGTNKWYAVSCTPVKDTEKKVIGAIISLTEITKRKLAELKEKIITEDLIERNNVLEQFAYIISHNLRGPVSTILGISELMQDEGVTDEDKRIFINGIAESVKKLDTVIIDLNTLIQSRNSDSQNKEAIHFSNILLDIMSGMEGVIDKTQVAVIPDFSEIDTIVTLKSYVHSIFYNLISNSIKYKQPDIPVVIEIKSRKKKNKLELIFKDNGMGIDLEKKGDEVFGLYKRFHPKTAEGKGMGLFMVKTQVETLGGKVSVKSQVNQGTQFTIELDV